MKNIINLNWLSSIVYYIQISNQIPSMIRVNNIYFTLILILSIVSSIIIRSINLDLYIIVSPLLCFCVYIGIVLSVFYIMYIQYTLVFRFGYLIKFLPKFIKLIATNSINTKVIFYYILMNIFYIFISVWIISRMLIFTNFYDLYTISLFISIIISSTLFYKYNKNFTELNYNIKKYPLWMVSMFTLILLILWLVIPISVTKIIENYTVVLERYNIYLKNELLNNMSPDINRGIRDNASETTVREELNENFTARSTSKTISDSNKNAVSSTSRATSSRGGYAIGEAVSETTGQVVVEETSVNVSPEVGTQNSTNPFILITDNDSVPASHNISTSTETDSTISNYSPGTGKLTVSKNSRVDILSFFKEEVNRKEAKLGISVESVDKLEVEISSIHKEEIYRRPLNTEFNINSNKQISKIDTNFKSIINTAKEKAGFTQIVGPRIVNNSNPLKIFYIYNNIKGLILPEKYFINYYQNKPWLPQYSKNDMCKYMFMMNLSNIKMIDLGNLIRELREKYHYISLEFEILELIVQEYNDLIYLLKYPGYLEKLYKFYNQLDILLQLDNDTKIVNKDSLDQITKTRFNRNVVPVAKFWLVWDKYLNSISEQIYSLSDLEIRFLYDLYQLKEFLYNGLEYYINYPISLNEFKELSNNIALKLLMCYKLHHSETLWTENFNNIFSLLNIELNEINWSILEVINNNFDGRDECKILCNKDYQKWKFSLNNQTELNMLRSQKSMTDVSHGQSGNISKHKNSAFKTIKKAASFWINRK